MPQDMQIAIIFGLLASVIHLGGASIYLMNILRNLSSPLPNAWSARCGSSAIHIFIFVDIAVPFVILIQPLVALGCLMLLAMVEGCRGATTRPSRVEAALLAADCVCLMAYLASSLVLGGGGLFHLERPVFIWVLLLRKMIPLLAALLDDVPRRSERARMIWSLDCLAHVLGCLCAYHAGLGWAYLTYCAMNVALHLGIIALSGRVPKPVVQRHDRRVSRLSMLYLATKYHGRAFFCLRER